MLERIIKFSIQNRWLVLLLTIVAAAIGAYSMVRLPIDAVPDITNNQVQINTLAPALSPLEIEKQVTFPIETALSGIPGLQSTRSLSRNGFSQVTAIFNDDVTSTLPVSRWANGCWKRARACRRMPSRRWADLNGPGRSIHVHDRVRAS